jgi:hypothetical protein
MISSRSPACRTSSSGTYGGYSAGDNPRRPAVTASPAGDVGGAEAAANVGRPLTDHVFR